MRNLQLGVTLVLAAGLVACNSDNGPDYASSIGPEDMGGAAETSTQFVQDAVNSMLSGEPGTELPDLPLAPAAHPMSLLDRLVLGARDNALKRSGHPELVGGGSPIPVSAVCALQVTGVDTAGNPIDTDDDGVPDDFRVTFPSGCTYSGAGSTTTYAGSLRFRDVVGLYGFQIDLSHFKYTYTNDSTGDYENIGINGTEHALYAASGATHSANLSYSIAILGVPFGGAPRPQLVDAPDYSSTFTWNESTAFDPASAISLAAPIPSGTLNVNLDFRAQVTDTSTRFFHFVLSTPTVLHYDADVCGDIDDGQIRGALNNSESIYFTITWTGCGATTYAAYGTTS